MSLSISKTLPIVEYDSSGNLITAAYWKIQQIVANPIGQTFAIIYAGYASAAAFNANPAQQPLMTKEIDYPDSVNAPGYAWPFTPAALAAAYPNNPLAFLMAAEAYAMQNPFFSGAQQVA